LANAVWQKAPPADLTLRTGGARARAASFQMKLTFFVSHKLAHLPLKHKVCRADDTVLSHFLRATRRADRRIHSRETVEAPDTVAVIAAGAERARKARLASCEAVS
jgi:hypothetical protein